MLYNAHWQHFQSMLYQIIELLLWLNSSLRSCFPSVTYIKVEDEVLIFAEHWHIEPVKQAFTGDYFLICNEMFGFELY